MLARDCGVYANRNPAAHEVRDDEGSLWRLLSPLSLPLKKVGRRRRRRGKSHGLRIRGCRKRPRMLACVRLLLLFKSKQRLRLGKRGRGDGKHCRSTDNHPEKQTTIAKLIQSRQAHVPHPLLPRRAVAPFASAPAAPGCRGGAPPRSFPDFSRVREIGPPDASSGQISRAAHPRLP